MLSVLTEEPGQYTGILTVYVSGEKKIEETISFEVSPPNIKLVEGPSGITQSYLGDIMELTFRLKNVGDSEAGDVRIEVDNPESISIIEISSPKDLSRGETGSWIVKLKADQTGDFQLQVNIFSSGFNVGEETFTVQVMPKPFWRQLPFIVGIAALIGIILIASLILMRKRRYAPTTYQMGAEKVRLCPSCGKQMTYVPTHRKWYCSRCRKYM
jgi:hypothetical protein